ncbi:endodeoxyribonuclease [Sphingomonas paeninsulae]|uniref:Endodeoxyribonuclease n=1 Tax=Sphingomonas paeninsulae TaxID=2319844 RepID=A0A494TE28_SPHPE|nr:endodeoxyribonuclease [Sphingomonas paeninsulae]AYJ85512.1 endodeoxyribonuclease [Sphingomonas paeninsulae]
MPQPWTSKRSQRQSSGKGPKLENGYRSGLEKRMADDLKSRGVTFEYETLKVSYEVPSRQAKYTPDFILPNGIIIEGKGLFATEDRQKHLLVKAQHPELDIRFVFSRSTSPLYKGSPTTYAAWCTKQGFQFADKLIPSAWLLEPPK